MAVDLLFRAGLSGPHLRFGTGGPPPATVALGGGSTLAAPTLAAPLRVGPLPLGAAPWPAPALAALALGYDNAVRRGPGSRTVATWQSAAARAPNWRLPHAASAARERATALPSAPTTAQRAAWEFSWARLTSGQRPALVLPWGGATGAGGRLAVGFAILDSGQRSAPPGPAPRGTAPACPEPGGIGRASRARSLPGRAARGPTGGSSGTCSPRWERRTRSGSASPGRTVDPRGPACRSTRPTRSTRGGSTCRRRAAPCTCGSTIPCRSVPGCSSADPAGCGRAPASSSPFRGATSWSTISY